MSLTELVRHLRAYCPLFKKRISGGIDFESIEASTKLQGVCAHVVLTDESAEDSSTQNVIRQNVAEQFDVCVEFPQAAGDERGRAVGDAVASVRAELCLALVGYRPGADYDPIQYVGRKLLLNNRAKAVYAFTFVTGYQLGRTVPTASPETWQEREQDGLPRLEGVDIDFDFIDPMVDKNLSPTGPDGRIEVQTREDLAT